MIIQIPKPHQVDMEQEQSESAKEKYININGPHFNKALCEYAISLMMKGGKPLEPVSKEQVDKLLLSNNITLKKNQGWDYVFVANMGKADYLGSSIPDEKHLALYIKDTIDDEDAEKGTTLCRWCATMKVNKHCIKWEDFI